MKGTINTSSGIGLPIALDDSNSIIIMYGSANLATFIKESLLVCYRFCKIGDNLVEVPGNKYSITLNNKSEVILVVDIGSKSYDPGCGETYLTWQPGIVKEQYRYEHQLASIMYDNYGISLDNFTKLVHEQYEAVPYHDITSTHERISAKKLYHVIETDNFGGDDPDEHFIGFINHEGNSHPLVFQCKEDAQVIANAFNQIRYGSNRYYGSREES